MEIMINFLLLLSAETEQGNAACRTLATTAKGLGDEVVCEGIETEEEA